MLHFLLFLLQFTFSSQYSLPKKYFINCGSKSSTNISNGRAFIGDQDNSDQTLKISYGNSRSVKDNNPLKTTPFLYHTARVYQNPSTYDLQITQIGTYIIRLHFFPFSAPQFNLSQALFSVSASGFSLLSDFNPRNLPNNTAVFEFFLRITQKKLRLYFVPSGNNSIAFVNAIEAFPAPDGFLPVSASRVTSSASNANFRDLLTRVLRTVHRVNVGGRKITPESDTLWRTWSEDDGFLSSTEPGFTKSVFTKINYNSERATKFIAPDDVYNSARFLNDTSFGDRGNFSRLEWGFPVDEDVSQHLIRAHFFDILSIALDYFNFSLFIFEKFEKSIGPYQEIPERRAPFYFDFVVEMNGSRFINVSIVAKPENYTPTRAFLNGLEIFAIENKTGLVPPESEPKNKPRTALIVAIIVSFVVVTAISIFTFFVLKRAKQKKDEKSIFFTSTVPKLPPNLRLKISFSEIQAATRNFHDELLLGEGGFGRVYRGTHNGVEVAVKRSKQGHGQGFEEFKTEIIVLSEIRHLHLVSLVGYCDEGSEMILVYEFMEKGTLREHLYDAKGDRKGSCFSWEKRLEICLGAAKGLNYLHSDAESVILHRDVKSTNILIDGNFVGKVADFGLSKTAIFEPNDEESVLKGSFGYFDPEYVKSTQYTEKSDVYSFGVVLLEIICARPAIFDLSENEKKVSLAKWGLAWQRRGKLEDIVDPFLVGKVNAESLRVVGDLAAKCLSESGGDRPAMKDVVWELSYAIEYQRNGNQGVSLDYTETNASLESAFVGVRGVALAVDEDDSRTEMSGLSKSISSASM